MIDWHRLFGIAFTLHFTNYPLTIELEKEMAIKRQILDVLIIQLLLTTMPGPMPDGLENLAKYNLLTYKSLQEALDDWTIKELTGHYVNYRKVISPSLDNLLPEEEFRLIAVCTRYPQKLVSQSGKNWKAVKQGVYDLTRGSDLIRVIVLKEIAQTEKNIIWQLFSAQSESVQSAARYYQQSNSEMNTIINDLFTKYEAEGIHMPYTLEDYRKEKARAALHLFTPEERLAGLTPEQRLAGLAPEQRLAGLAPAEIVAGLSDKDRDSLAKAILSQSTGGEEQKKRAVGKRKAPNK